MSEARKFTSEKYLIHKGKRVQSNFYVFGVYVGNGLCVSGSFRFFTLGHGELFLESVHRVFC